MRLVYLFSIYRCFCSLLTKLSLDTFLCKTRSTTKKWEKWQRNRVFATNSDFLPMPLQPNVVDLWDIKLWILYLWSNSLSLKWQRFVPSDCKDIGFKNLRKKLSSFVLNMSNKDRKSELAGSRTELLNQSVQSSKMNLCLIGFCHFNTQREQINIQDKYLY